MLLLIKLAPFSGTIISAVLLTWFLWFKFPWWFDTHANPFVSLTEVAIALIACVAILICVIVIAVGVNCWKK